MLVVCVGFASAEAQNPYSRPSTLTVLGEHSDDSSHIILVYKLAGVGVQYERRMAE